MFLILFVSNIRSNSLSKQKYFSVEDKLSPVLKHGFLRSEKDVNKFQNFMVYECWCVL